MALPQLAGELQLKFFYAARVFAPPVAQRAVDAMVALLADFAAIEDTQAVLARPLARARVAPMDDLADEEDIEQE